MFSFVCLCLFVVVKCDLKWFRIVMMQKKVKERFLALVKWKFDVNSLSGGQLFASME